MIMKPIMLLLIIDIDEDLTNLSMSDSGDIELDDGLEFSAESVVVEENDDEGDLVSENLIDDIEFDLGEDQDQDEGDEFAELEVSDLELDDDYDELRTQYELAKVFADLGDEDGARKILNDIVADSSADEALLSDAKSLLETIS